MTTARRALVTGASGLLGRAVLKEFSDNASWDVLGLAFSRAQGALRKVDITDPQQVEQVLEEFKPSVIIHCAAERRPDRVEKEQEATKALNVTATENICQQAAKRNIIVLYVSTDYVFDGKNPPYSETATPNPLNKYGESKLEGEQVTMATSKGNLVFRISALYGPVEHIMESPVTCLFPKVQDLQHTCIMSHYERRFPTSTADIAKVLLQLLEKRLEDSSLSGYFNWSSEENMTKYDMAVAMAEVFGLPSGHIEADSKPSGGAVRPYDAHLDSSRIEKLGICLRTPFKEGIQNCLKQFVTK